VADHPLVVDVVPDLAAVVVAGLRASGEDALADQVDRLRYHGPCGCDSVNCRSVRTAPPPDGAYGPGHRNVMLEPTSTHLVVLDVVGSDIVFVEFI
jgi:hypothetical protein